jgi:hypothetical protein
MTKLFLAIFGLFFCSLTLPGALTPSPALAPAPKEQEAYGSGQFGLSYFASYRVREFDGVLDRFGSGPELSYSFTRNFTLALEGISENPQGSFFDEAGANGKYYVPISDSGVSFYGLLGYTRRFEDLPGAVTTRARADDKNRMNAGLGLELRGAPKGLFGLLTVSAFADGRWTHDFKTVGHALFRLGAKFEVAP